jgi:hypothetical protein
VNTVGEVVSTTAAPGGTPGGGASTASGEGQAGLNVAEHAF